MSNSQSIDDEWSSYLMTMKQNTNLTIDNISKTLNEDIKPENNNSNITDEVYIPSPPPVCTELNISTQTKVLFLNKSIDVEDIFWKIPILDYWVPSRGILKKTVKIVSLTKEKVEELTERLKYISCYKEDIIKQIDVQSTSRTKFKDERKITIGICKKDIMACRTKKKNVFYNCFSLVIRICCDNINAPYSIVQDNTIPDAREIHVKIFNTGKMEIPGILNNEIFIQSRQMILDVLRPLIGEDCDYINGDAGNNIPNFIPSSSVNILINSNFNVGFYINREKLHYILRSEKYNMNSSYDPCTYPGVKCKFYFNLELGLDTEKQTGVIIDKHAKMKTIISEKKYIEISIMIFRTGSGLIVGNCSEIILNFIFKFIVKILHDEYYNIYIIKSSPVTKQKNTKIRRKTIQFNKINLENSQIITSPLQKIK